MAKYNKKRARELQHDRFRDSANTIFDRLGHLLEGKGRTILYGLLGIVLVAILAGVWIKWRAGKDDEARRALGRAIAIANAPLLAAAVPNADPKAPKFVSERERSQSAVEEFQKVAAKYGDPYRTEARYFIATHMLLLDRDKALAELAELTRSSADEVATLSKFALAQQKMADAKYDEAAQILVELGKQNGTVVTQDTANLYLADVYAKQGKKKEAAELLFNIVDTARKAKDKDGAPLPEPAASGAAAEKLQKLDPDRYAQLTPALPSGNLSF